MFEAKEDSYLINKETEFDNNNPDRNKECEKTTVKILIVDDEQLYRKSLASALKFKADKDSFTVRIDEAGSLRDALKQLKQNDYHIVMTDGVFPEVNGGFVSALYEHDFRGNRVIEAAKAKGVKLVIGISSEPKRFQQADLVFEKPLDPDLLRGAVKQIVKKI